jgi:hypothetical protein
MPDIIVCRCCCPAGCAQMAGTGCSGSSLLTSQQRAQHSVQLQDSSLVGRVQLQQQAAVMRGAASWPSAWLGPLQQWTGCHPVCLQQQQQHPTAEGRPAAAAVLSVLPPSRSCALCLPVAWCCSRMT